MLGCVLKTDVGVAVESMLQTDRRAAEGRKELNLCFLLG